MKRKFGITAECLHGDPQDLRAIKAAGFETVHTGHYYARRDVEAFKSQAVACGLDYEFIHAPFANINSMWLAGDEYLTIYQGIEESILSASEFEIPTICLHVSSGWTPPAINDLGLARFDRLIELAHSKNVTVAIENQRLPEYLAFFMERYRHHDAVGFCYDCGHAHCFTPGSDPLSLYGDRLVCTHLHDNLGFSADRTAKTDLHLLPLDGNIDYSDMMRLLDAYHYHGSLTLEVFKTTSHNNYADLSDADYLKKAYDAICWVARCHINTPPKA